MKTSMNFGETLVLLKQGKKVSRNGWNGKGMFLWLKPATTIKSEWCKDPMLKTLVDENGGEMAALGTINCSLVDVINLNQDDIMVVDEGGKLAPNNVNATKCAWENQAITSWYYIVGNAIVSNRKMIR